MRLESKRQVEKVGQQDPQGLVADRVWGREREGLASRLNHQLRTRGSSTVFLRMSHVIHCEMEGASALWKDAALRPREPLD